MSIKNKNLNNKYSHSQKLYTVFDLEFYGLEPQHNYGNLKQIGIIVFNDKYDIVETFDITFIDEAGQREFILKKVDELMLSAEINFAWGCHQDIKTMHSFGFDLSRYTIEDMQTPFLHHTNQN